MSASESPQPERGRPSSDLAAGLRVAVIGARRARQGTGPYLALQAAAAGAEIVGVLGTRPSTAREAAEFLQAHGQRPKAYTDHEEMLEDLEPDVVIIASPLGSHRAWLGAALEARAHVYCEKPLTTASPESSEKLIRAYAARNLVLQENCQWPEVLPAFRALHPGVDPAEATRFRMLLAPPMRGLIRWQEVLSHPLSLLQVLHPGPVELDAIHFTELEPESADSRLDFEFKTLDRVVHCEVVLEDLEVFPRPAEFAFDDALCRRQVRASDYGMSFTDGQDACQPRTVGDPMENCLRGFLERVQTARAELRAPIEEALIRRQYLLFRLLEAYRETAS